MQDDNEALTRPPWTAAELAELRRSLGPDPAFTNGAEPHARPLPPMNEDDAGGLLMALVEAALTRPLTVDEAFLGGQLLSAYRQAVEGRVLLGRPDRYMVATPSQVADTMGRYGVRESAAVRRPKGGAGG